MAGGRPPLYNNCMDFAAMCEMYFDECDAVMGTVVDKEGGVHEVPNPDPYLKSGLAMFLDLSTETLRHYYSTPGSQFSAIIKKAYTRIQNDLEKRAIVYGKQQATGCIFNLKCNHGMIETSKLEVTGDGGGPIKTETTITSDMTPKEAAKAFKDQIKDS